MSSARYRSFCLRSSFDATQLIFVPRQVLRERKWRLLRHNMFRCFYCSVRHILHAGVYADSSSHMHHECTHTHANSFADLAGKKLSGVATIDGTIKDRDRYDSRLPNCSLCQA